MEMAKRYMKICSRSPIIRGMQIKTTVRCYFLHVRIVIFKKTRKSIGEDMGKGNPYSFLVGM